MAATATSLEYVQKMFIAYFGRPAAPTGLEYYGQLVDAGNVAALQDDFWNSAESQSLFGQSTTEGKVNGIFNQLFGRDAAVAGLTYWTTEINAGRVSLPAAALTILNSAAAADLGVFNAKLAVAEAFTAELDTVPEVLAFQNNTDAARELLAGVETQAEADAVIADIADEVAAVVAGGETNPGQTFTLTAGADNIAATSGNDTINALTINAAGAAATTFSAFDVIDGGAGTDTLNVYSDNTNNLNDAFPSTITVKNVEIVNILNANAAAGVFGDASKYEGVQQLWQVGFADNVTKLAATTTAGFKTVDANVSVAPTDAAASAAIALDNYGEGHTITVDGSAAAATLNAVTVSGTVKDTNGDATVAATTLAVTTGKDVESVTVTTAVKTTLTVTENAASGATKDVRTVDASASTGAVTFAGSATGGTAGSVATIKGGSGDDTLTIVTATLKDDASTAADETVSASVQGGAGKDAITVNTTGTGTTTVSGGDGNDTVTLTADGSGKLTVDLGAGDDTFKGAGAVAGTDLIDGGAGSDSLLLNMVGAANIAAFQNFEVFDAAGLAKTLDVDILATKNTVTEITTSGDVGAAAALTNVGAGVGYRVIGDAGVANALTITQKTAGALTITLDVDEPSTTAAGVDNHNVTEAAVVAANATSVKAVFDSSFKDASAHAGFDNLAQLNITGTKATSLEVVSGGAFAENNLNYTSGDDATAGKGDLLTSVTISGDRALSFAVTEATTTELTTVNASAMTGALTFALDDLKAAGTLTLGSGDDVITAQTGVAVDVATIVAAQRKISGIEKGTAEDSTIQGNYDVIKLAGAVQALDDAAGTADASVKDGKITFKGAGPATLDQAVTFAQALIDANEAAVFEYVGNTYIFAEGATDGAGTDVLIQLTGVTGLNGLDAVNAAAGTLYVF